MILDVEMPPRRTGRPTIPLWDKVAAVPVGRSFALVKGDDYMDDTSTTRGRLYRAMYARGIRISTAIVVENDQEYIHCTIKSKEESQ